jgi:hypothetical protein
MAKLRLGGAFELGDVEFFHLKHGLHGLRVLDEVGQASGYDLPGQTELVLQPAALHLAAPAESFDQYSSTSCCESHRTHMRTGAHVLAVGRVADATLVRGLFP